MTCSGVYSISHQLGQVCCWCCLHYSFIHSGIWHIILALESGYFFMNPLSLWNFPLCSCVIFLALLHCLSELSHSSLSFLKAIILNSLSENYLGSVTRKLLFPLVVSHFVFLGVVLLSLPLKEESRLPVFPAQLCMRNDINCRPCWRLWGVLRPFLWMHSLLPAYPFEGEVLGWPVFSPSHTQG